LQEKYITVSSSGEAEIVEKKSRFIAHVKVIESEQDALAFIEETKKKYWDARHNCYAYQLGENHRIQRYNDDGEPGGTAGMPILEVLKGNDVHNTIIIVTRYFGGVLLGTGGLVRAYTKASVEGLKAAGLCEVVLYKEVIVTSDYSLSGKVQFETLQAGHIIDATEYTDNVTFHILCELPLADGFAEDIVNVTAGKADITFGEERYIKREIKEK
jgi:uncharacterized YigZ family protein